MNDKFDDFQIEEYKNISNAHFETNKQIGIFYRYFLIVASAPALIFIWFGKDNPNFLNDLLKGNSINVNLFVGFFLIFIGIIGLLSSFYLISLRLDAILYARTVNGVRKYFFNNVNINNKEQYRVLPIQTNVPKYFDNHTFGVLFYAVAIINSAYLSIGTRVIASIGSNFFENYLHIHIVIKDYNLLWTIFTFFVVFILHIYYFYIISKYRRISYMKSRIIGIDIDGVLNKHEETFCKIYNENKNINDDKDKLKPNEIIKIPVSLIKGKNIERDDEFDVFNNPKYWENQIPIDDNIGKTIQELKNSYGFNIRIHSYRPWPLYSFGRILKRKEINNNWGIKQIKIFKKYYIVKGKKKLTKITKKWLKENKIPISKKYLFWKHLYIEKSSIDNSHSKKSFFSIFGISIFKNRFYYTAKTPYRYFVEDDINNAIKLASNCEYVFLINHPYNQVKDNKIPINIIRVNNWNEIKSIIKELG